MLSRKRDSIMRLVQKIKLAPVCLQVWEMCSSRAVAQNRHNFIVTLIPQQNSKWVSFSISVKYYILALCCGVNAAQQCCVWSIYKWRTVELLALKAQRTPLHITPISMDVTYTQATFNLTILSVPNTIYCQIVGWLVNSELKRIWKEVIMA